MARNKGVDADDEAPEEEAEDEMVIEDPPELFPELDKTKPEEKLLRSKILKYERDDLAHKDGIATLKKKRDVSEDEVRTEMHKLNISKVRVGESIYELRSKGERVAKSRYVSPTADEPVDD